jgi:hypothetical protein
MHERELEGGRKRGEKKEKARGAKEELEGEGGKERREKEGRRKGQVSIPLAIGYKKFSCISKFNSFLRITANHLFFVQQCFCKTSLRLPPAPSSSLQLPPALRLLLLTSALLFSILLRIFQQTTVFPEMQIVTLFVKFRKLLKIR